MSVSSLRVDAITPDVVKTLVAAGQKILHLQLKQAVTDLDELLIKI